MAARDDVTGSGIEALQARVDAAGLALMSCHPNLRRMSLDEWVAEHRNP